MAETSIEGIRRRGSGKRYFEIELVNYVADAGDTQAILFGLIGNGLSWTAGINGYGRGYVEGSEVWTPSVGLEAGDVVRVWHDIDTGQIWLGINDTVTGDPVAGTGPANPDDLLPTSVSDWRAYAKIPFFDSSNPPADTTTCRLRAKTSQFLLGPGAGWLPWED